MKKAAKMDSRESFTLTCAKKSFCDVLVGTAGVAVDGDVGLVENFLFGLCPRDVGIEGIPTLRPCPPLDLQQPVTECTRPGRRQRATGKENVKEAAPTELLPVKPKRKYIRKPKVTIGSKILRAAVGGCSTVGFVTFADPGIVPLPKQKRKYTRRDKSAHDVSGLPPMIPQILRDRVGEEIGVELAAWVESNLKTPARKNISTPLKCSRGNSIGQLQGLNRLSRGK